MPKIFITTIKKVQQAVIAGALNFVVRPMVAVRVRARATFVAARANPAVKVMIAAVLRSRTNPAIKFVTAPFTAFAKFVPAIMLQARLVLASRWNAGLQLIVRLSMSSPTKPAFTAMYRVSGTIRTFVNAAIAVTNKTIGTLSFPQKLPAYNVLETTIELVRTLTITTATQGQVPGLNRTDWTNVTNVQGAVNGTVATINGNALAVRNGRLILTYPATTGKTTMTITKVELWLYYQTVGAVGNIDNLFVRAWYTPPGGTDPGTLLFQSSGPAKNALTTPDVIDITTFIAGSWTNIDDIKLFIDAQIPILSGGITLTVDAMLLKIYATRTETN